MKIMRHHYLFLAAVALSAALITATVSLLSGCATTKGAAVGAGIGAMTGDAGRGARIGASTGAIVDILD
jgi:hypothetical protein